MQLRDRVAVEVEADVRVLAVHHVDLGEAGELVLRSRVSDKIVSRDRVRLLLLLGRGEGAELALHAADVRLVQVHVLDEEDIVRSTAQASCEIGKLPDLEQVVRFENREAVLEIEPFTGFDLLPDGRERRLSLEGCHGFSRCGSRRHLRELPALPGNRSKTRGRPVLPSPS